MKRDSLAQRHCSIARAGAGGNNIPVDRLSELGVVVFNTPGANANAVKELVIAGLLVAARNIVPALEFVSNLDLSRDDYERQMEAVLTDLGADCLKTGMLHESRVIETVVSAI